MSRSVTPRTAAAAPAGLPPPFTVTTCGLRLALKVTPKAASDRLDGVVAEADGGTRLKVAVTAAAQDGRANAAVIALLARRLDLPPSAFSLERGATARRKTLTIAGNGAELAARMAAWLDAASPAGSRR